MEVIALSDLHGTLPEIKDPAEIMLIAGDIIPLYIQFNKPLSKKWFLGTFAEWINSLPVEKVFMVAGNHDAFLQDASKSFFLELYIATKYKLQYLRNETAEYIDKEGISWKIFGTPYCHFFGNWPFMRSDEVLEEKFKEIPEDVDIIITHDPPYNAGYADCVLDKPFPSSIGPEHLGNYPLRKKLEKTKFLLCVTGHIHSGDHRIVDFLSGKVVNVSINDENYKNTYPILYTTLYKYSTIPEEEIISDYEAFKELSSEILQEGGIIEEEDKAKEYLSSCAFYDVDPKFIKETIYNYIKDKENERNIN